jgi:ATP-dependent protease HslVU (ClpYQ) peptidase subunit
MTCIVGIVESGKVYIGGESAGVNGYTVTIRSDPKVFRMGDFLIGFTTSFRMGQLIRYTLHAPIIPDGMELFHYMVTLFVENVRECLKAGGYARRDAEQESGGCFLVGYAGRLFTIDNDYQVAESTCGYAAIGSGTEVALGALYATQGGVPRTRLGVALEAAAQHTIYVRSPFVIEEL